MFYEEKIINNTLMYRTDPNGTWKRVEGVRSKIVFNLLKLEKSERLKLLILTLPDFKNLLDDLTSEEECWMTKTINNKDHCLIHSYFGEGECPQRVLRRLKGKL